MGLPWWSSGWDSMLPMQGAQVQSLVEELDSAHCNCFHAKMKIPQAAPKTQYGQINKNLKKSIYGVSVREC